MGNQLSPIGRPLANCKLQRPHLNLVILCEHTSSSCCAGPASGCCCCGRASLLQVCEIGFEYVHGSHRSHTTTATATTTPATTAATTTTNIIISTTIMRVQSEMHLQLVVVIS